MRWPMPRRAEDPTETELVDETPVEPMQTATPQDEIEVPQPSTDPDEPDHDDEPKTAKRRIQWSKAIAYGLLPGLVFLLASAAGYLKWQDGTAREAQAARVGSVQAATDSTVALLSYRPDTVETDLDAAKSRLTGTFLDAYTKLTHDLVIPGAKQKQISAGATLPPPAPPPPPPTPPAALP